MTFDLVLNPDGDGVQVAQAFTYRGPAPSVSKVSPTTGPASGGTEVTVDGANFQAGASVSVDGLPATVLSVTAARIVMRDAGPCADGRGPDGDQSSARWSGSRAPSRM